MSRYRRGDQHVDGVQLRLTISSLAEIADELDAEGPKELARILRSAGRAEWAVVLSAMSTPRQEVTLSDAELAKFLPAMANVISEALS